MARISVGDRYGRLTIIKETDKRKRDRVVWKCKCDCGEIVQVVSTDLTTGDTQSCGCLKKELEDKNLRDEYENKRIDGVAVHFDVCM